jgi:hypothetical protein
MMRRRGSKKVQETADQDNVVTKTCESCQDCDLRNFGFCSNAKAREQLDLWNGIIFKPKEFGCVHWTPRSD